MADGNLQVDPIQVFIESARTNYAAFVSAVHRPRFKHSEFSRVVCAAVDKFVEDVLAGKRPVLMLTAAPQHGKSSLISRCLPPYLFGRLGLQMETTNIACASYSLARAAANARDARSIMHEPMYKAIFPHASLLGFKGGISKSDEFDTPKGALYAVGVEGPLTGRSIHIGLLDDGVKNSQDALSTTVQESLINWYESTYLTRMQQQSGIVVIGTPWSAHDLLARVRKKHEKDPHFTLLRFPAINRASEVGYNPDLKEGALVPELHTEEKLLEVKSHLSEHWWCAMYQSAPMAEMGVIFGRDGLRHYRRKDLPLHFVQVIMTLDCAFKDKVSSDFTAAGVWGKTQDGRVWLLEMRRQKLSFTATVAAVADLKRAYPQVGKILVEDAANGAAVVDVLKSRIPGIIGVPPTGSKESRAHAVSWAWTSGQVMLPSPEDVPGIAPIVAEIVSFPDVGLHDDAVDCMVIALQHLCLRSPISSMITNEILNKAGVKR